MGTVLLTLEYGKEEAGAIEALDVLMPHDPGAKAERPPFGGLVLISTALDPDAAAGIMAGAPTSYIRSVSPVDAVVPSEMGAIMEAVGERLPRPATGTAAVRCARRGRAIGSSQEVERAAGDLLRRAGYAVDLANPSIVVRIDVIGGQTAISIRPPDRFFKKGCQG